MKEIGLYVHIPFCQSKCYYCDFNSFENKDNMIDEYITALINEINKKATSQYIVKTIFIGGGTPSYIHPKYISKIMNTIMQKHIVNEKAEITIEANPGTVNKEKLEIYRNSGINRLSIGLQSANNNILKQIGRIHNYSQYVETIKLAQQAGFKNINTDIMIGLPYQKIEDVEETINNIIKLNINHISVYSLIVEEGTKIEKMLENKQIKLPDENEERKMYWKGKAILEKNGFEHYEISNYAKKGYYSKHNLDCWKQKEYVGFGISASSYMDGKRFSNTPCIEEYINNIKQGKIEKNENLEEIQTEELMQNEFMILGLRKIEGIQINEFIEKFHKNPLKIYKQKLEKLKNKGLILINENNIRLSNTGIDLANLVWQEFV